MDSAYDGERSPVRRAMVVREKEAYQRHRESRTGIAEFLLTALLFGSVGAITWAIRGTSGWGGVDGTIVPGMTWGLLWYYACNRKGIDARSIPLWLGLGIAIGGGLGYGQYVSWIRGEFRTAASVMPVAPWIGFAWFVICGVGWGGPGGILLGWALDAPASRRRWLVRLLVPVCVGFAGWLLVKACPWLFFPNYHLGIYAGELDRHLTRTVETNTQNFVVAAWWVGALLVAAIQKERATLTVGVLIGAGFGIGFALAALWCLGYSYSPEYIDWWKMWELNAGFNLGLLYTVALYWAIRRVDKRYDANGELPENCASAVVSQDARDRRGSIALASAVCVLLFILFFGASFKVGALLGLYKHDEVEQYSWPVGRVAIFLPFGIAILGATAYKIVNVMRVEPARAGFQVPYLPERVADLIAVISVVGVATIWPSKIGVLYVAFLSVALFALNRLNHRSGG